MASVYKVVEIVGTSKKSWEKAATNAVERAGKSLDDLRIAEVQRLDIQTKDGKPCTFVAQFCFADSRHLVSDKLPDDVMLVFFSDSDDGIDPKGVVIEWSPIEIAKPMTGSVPKQELTVPELSGVLYESEEYPDGLEVAYAAVDPRLRART